ncbi:SDR family NAD(P)-dependent oxidoreductase [Novosphingobium mangrovi (ex Hu et al. 2023)]|uniref:SDR family oxidoreductase n=1 Tax=Novosphingobium mangrovi (ex Hu et al. 2023) TaxID=2930094 RepID=A0ABT0AGR5_9SPHN|nr:SDR family oxidoreductase [Novosphingobium mangrovi (ex Hu et al. 2023)]MCJ1962372.1 SDR family oxidoreductase [Novosphingobium mangrovi (ex Hu et al. 2023)]
MAGELDGKVAIVTGGAGGIGKATVDLFVAEGARVVVADVDMDAGESLCAKLGSAAVFRRVDVAQKGDVEALVDVAVQRFGRLDVMFNNAGIACGAFPDFLDDTLEDFGKVVGVNLFGPMVGTQAAARAMKQQGRGGAILNNASIAGVLAGQAMMTYRASKAGLIHFSKSAAIDLARHGIRVNCLVPGHIRTPLSSFEEGSGADNLAQLSQEIDAIYLSNQPLKRRGSPEDVAQAALFLASDRAAQITGIALPVEGGVTTGDPVNHLADILEARSRVLGT